MKLESIISMANAPVRLQFIAMERSLRATGCDLPLRVIPYDDRLFDLPPNASWWNVPELTSWLQKQGSHPTTRKYQCLLMGQYQFVDADICFLRDPRAVLDPFAGFVASCTEWNKSSYTYPTDTSKTWMYRQSSTWQKSIFSAGQFACDRPLYASVDRLKAVTSDRAHMTPCLHDDHEQVGLNMLVAEANIPFTNLTLPPHNMQSTWAGDYPGEYDRFWQEEETKPYLMHWAGPVLEWDRPINEIFYSFLSRDERAEWDAQVRPKVRQDKLRYERSLPLPRRVARMALRLVGLRPGIHAGV